MELERLFGEICQISDPILVARLVETAQVTTLKKGQLLIRQGERQGNLFFLLHGILRGYFLDTRGRDITDCFAFEFGAPAMPSFEFGESAPINIETITDSELASLPLAVVDQVLKSSPEAVQTYANLVLRSAKRHWEIKTVLYQYTATQKYQWFLQAYPELICHVSGRHIASVLGMTPVTLSRLKRTLHEQARKR